MSRLSPLRIVETGSFVLAALAAVASLRIGVVGVGSAIVGMFPISLAALAIGFAASGAVSVQANQPERGLGSLLGLSGFFFYTVAKRHWYGTATVVSVATVLVVAYVAVESDRVSELAGSLPFGDGHGDKRDD
ncbi:hypothetical protein [Haloarchaeobius sp. TZWWS8]|uniref:hypothetical protein n=1 Tax=Haloarchaeobius sp. TZWWS8 TaxID=3446121 RepID=UPI003EB9E6AE